MRKQKFSSPFPVALLLSGMHLYCALGSTNSTIIGAVKTACMQKESQGASQNGH